MGRAKGDRPGRAWLLAEAAALPVAVATGVLLWPRTPAVLAHVVLAVVGSWVYPLLTVHLPHDRHGDTQLTQTRTLRGRIVPAAVAIAVMAFYLGLEMMTHIDGDRARGDAVFAAAEPLVGLLGPFFPTPPGQ